MDHFHESGSVMFQDEPQSLPIGKFHQDQWQEVPSASHSADRTELTFATFNVWFGGESQTERHQAIVDILKKHQPDFIALQEVQPGTLGTFLNQEWIEKEYSVSDFTGASLGSYGTVLLSKIPVHEARLYPLTSMMDRSLLMVTAQINGMPFSVGTVHLESKKYSADVRAIQLGQVLEILASGRNVVLMGDFNFCASWREENRQIPPEYLDTWAVLRGNEPGYTEDTTINRMCYILKGKHKHVRFDRILLKSTDSRWSPTHIELLGTEPISEELPDVFPSDHFGLFCRISAR